MVRCAAVNAWGFVQIITKMGGTPPKLDTTLEEDEAPFGSQQPVAHSERHGMHRLATEHSIDLPSSSGKA